MMETCPEKKTVTMKEAFAITVTLMKGEVEKNKQQAKLIRELLEVVEFYRWTHPSELFEIDEYTMSTNPMVTSSGKKAYDILNSESVKQFKEIEKTKKDL